MQSFKLTSVAAAIVTVLALGACSSDDDPAPAAMATYDIAVTNITNAQPMTPLAVVLHKHGYSAWSLGSAASSGLEMLAEGGATTNFLNEADANSNVVVSTTGGGVTPGTTTTVSMTIPVADVVGLHVSLASMFANTNDAFTGVSTLHIADLAVNASTSAYARVYDAGTEANTEAQTDMPGPLGSGASGGFDAARETLDRVTIHAGVISADDGLSGSNLTEADRWLGTGAKVTVTRTQ